MLRKVSYTLRKNNTSILEISLVLICTCERFGVILPGAKTEEQHKIHFDIYTEKKLKGTCKYQKNCKNDKKVIK